MSTSFSRWYRNWLVRHYGERAARRRLALETLEDRVNPNTYTLGGSPVTIPIHGQIGSRVHAEVNFSTTDPNDQAEGEPVVININGGGGAGYTISQYGTKDFPIPITSQNESLSAFIKGADEDESATLKIDPYASIKINNGGVLVYNPGPLETYMNGMITGTVTNQSDESATFNLQVGGNSGGQVKIPNSIQVPANSSKDFNITGISDSSKANDVEIDVSYDGTKESMAKMTVASVTFSTDANGDIYNMDTPQSMLDQNAYRIPPTKNTPVQVTIMPDLSSAGQSVTVGVTSIDGSNNSQFGTATIDGGSSEQLSSSQTVQLQGQTQTAPQSSLTFGAPLTASSVSANSNAGQLVMAVLDQNGKPTAMSNGFSVAAIPLSISITGASSGGIGTFGFTANMGVASDSGNLGDLDQVGVGEFVDPPGTTPTHTGYYSTQPPTQTSNGLYTGPASNHNYKDIHTTNLDGGVVPSNTAAGTAIDYQYYQFIDARTGVTAIPIPNSGFVITKTYTRTNFSVLGKAPFSTLNALTTKVPAPVGPAMAGIGNHSDSFTFVEPALPPPHDPLEITAQPALDVVAGGAFSVEVSAENADGTVNTSFNGAITATLNPINGSGALGGTSVVTAVTGVADFSNLTVSQTGAYFLSFSASGLPTVTSDPFKAADKLAFTTAPPSGLVAGAAFGVVVKAENNAGAVDSGFSGVVTLSGNGLVGTRSATAVNGVATFSGLTLTEAGNYNQVSAGSSGLPTISSNYISVTGGAAAQLVVGYLNGQTTVNGGFTVTVYAEDKYGNTDPSYDGSVTLALSSNSTGAALNGTTTVKASGGVASFPGVSVNTLGGGYTLEATASGLTAGVSYSFNAEDQLVFATQPPATVAAGSPVSVTVDAEDGKGVVNTAFHGPVSLYIEQLGTISTNAVNGAAVFPNLILKKAGTYQEFEASTSQFGYAYSNYFQVTGGSATQFAVSAPSGNVLGGVPFSVTVSAVDPDGNVDDSYNGSVTLALGENPTNDTLGGTLAGTVTNGTAMFSGLTLNKLGSGYTLVAFGGLASGSSPPFSVTDQLTIPNQPSNETAGSPFTFTVDVTNGQGVIDSSFNGPVSISCYNLLGAATMNAVNGVAAFTGLSVDVADEYEEFSASSPGLATIYSGDFNVTAGAATKLVVRPSTGSTEPDARFSVTVNAVDPYGNTDSTFSEGVTLSLASNPGGATLGGALLASMTGGSFTFNNITLNQVSAGYTIQASAANVNSGTSAAVNVSDQLVVTTPPPSQVAAGSTFGLIVSAEDGLGDVNTSFNGNVTVAANGLNGSLTVAAVNGVATFSGLSLTYASNYDELTISSSSLPTTYTSEFAVVAGAASKLVFNEAPTNATLNGPFNLVVDAEDKYGNVAPAFSGTVTLSLSSNPGSASLGGTLSVQAIDGVATFTGLTLNVLDAGYVIKAASGELTAGTTPAIDVTDQLVFTNQPTTATAGAPFEMDVAVEDGQGNVVTTFSGVITLSEYGLRGKLTATAVNGVAKFPGLSLTEAGSYNYVFAGGGGLPQAESSEFAVNAAPATQLVVETPSVIVNGPFTLTVNAEDQYGNIDPTSSGQVAVALQDNPGGATLGGTATVAAVNGVATFPGLTLNVLGSGYTIQATASGLITGVSSPFSVTDQLVVTTQPPSTVTAGQGFGAAVTVEDGLGVVNTSFSGTATVSLVSYGSTLGGTVNASVVNGVAAFSGLTLSEAGSYQSLSFSAGNLPAVASGYFTVAAAAATKLVVVPPTNANVLFGAPFAIQVDAEDPNGNIDPTYSGAVSLALAGNPTGAVLGGALTVSAANGVATFSGLTISSPGSGYTLQATASNLVAGTSTAFAATDQLVVAAQPPSTVTAGTSFGLVVKVEDGANNVATSFTGEVSLSGYNLGGKLVVAAVDGIATFTGLSITSAGEQSITVSVGGLPSISTAYVTASAAPATQWAVEAPYEAVQKGPFSVTVDAKDQYGNIDTSYNGTVALALDSNTAGATLSGAVTAPVVDGVAQLSGLSINDLGAYTVKAAGGSLSSGVSSSFTVEDQLVVLTQPPATVTAGATLGAVVAVEDGLGNVNSSYDGGIYAYASDNLLGGTTTVDAVNGEADFTSLSLSNANNDSSLDFGGSSILNVESNTIIVTPGAATQLQASAPATSPLVNDPFTLTVKAFDLYGNLDTSFSGSVTISLSNNPSSATLGGVLTVDAVGGVATFTGLTLNQPGAGYAIQAASSGLTAGATSFNVSYDQLVIQQQPPGSIGAGDAFGVTVAVENGQGVVDSSFSGNISLSSSGGSLVGTYVIPAVNGVAAFTGLSIEQAGSVTLTADSLGLPTAQTDSIQVAPEAATQLVVGDLGNVVAGASFQVLVTAEDQYGNTDTSFSGVATLALAGNPSDGALSGATEVPISYGYGSFSGVSIDITGNGYSLSASSTGLSSGLSSTFNVTDQLVVTTPPPPTVTAGSPFGLVVKAEDADGNVDASFNGAVSLSSYYYSGGTLGGAATETAVNGVAAFSGLTLTQDTSYGEIYISSPNLPEANTATFTVKAGAASQLSVAAPTGNVLTNGKFTEVVTVRDKYGNEATSFTGAVTLALAANPAEATLGGALTADAVDGVATFSTLTLSKSGMGFTLKATASGLSAGTSPGFSAYADQLVLTTPPPATVTAGAPFTLVVAAEKAGGATDSSFNGTLTLAGYGFDSINATAVNGVAAFSNVTLIHATGAEELDLSATGAAPIQNLPIAVVAGKATQLVFQGPYGDGSNNVVSAPFSLEVDAEDGFGNINFTYSGPVAISLDNNPGNAVLNGQLTVNATDGVAYFNNMAVSNIGDGYTLQATATGLQTGVSESFGVTDQLVVTSGPPSSFTAGTPFSIVVADEITTGDVDTTFDGPVTLSLSNFSGGPNTGLTGDLTVDAINGIATFDGISMTQAGSFAILLNANGPSGTDALIKVAPASAAQLVLMSEPPTAITTGSNFGISLEAVDAYGNLATTFSGAVNLSLANNPSGAALGGTHIASALAGRIQFSNVSVAQPGSGYTLEAASGGLTAAISAPFTVSAAGRATNLIFSTQPASTVTAGDGFKLVVKAVDSTGALDPSYNGAITLTDANGTLTGTLTATANGGVASFSGLINDFAAADTIAASAAGLVSATSISFTVDAQPASQLVVSDPDSNAILGSVFGVEVEAEDQFGNIDPTFNGKITLSLANNSTGATLNGGGVEPATAGVLDYSYLSITKPGSNYTLAASASGLTSGVTDPFNVTIDQLVTTTQPPQNPSAGTGFSLVVQAENGSGTLDASFNGAVTATLVDFDDAGAALSGATATASGGVVDFTNLTVSKPGLYSLLLNSPGLAEGVTAAFTVAAGSAGQLLISVEPPSIVSANSGFGVAVTVLDGSGNIDANFSGSVTLSLDNNPGSATLGGATTATAVDGVASFSGLTISTPGSGYTLQAATAGVSTAATSSINVIASGLPTQLVVAAEPPGSITAGSPITIVVKAEDPLFGVATSFSGTVTLTDPFGNAIAAIPAVNGVATFTGVAFDQVDSYEELTATAAGLPAATTAFSVTAAAATRLVVFPENADILSGAAQTFEVEALDPSGNVDPAFNKSVTLSLASNPGDAVLGGALTATLVHGAAAFSGVTVSQPGMGYTLQAAGGGLTGSTSFDVTADELVASIQPPASVTAGDSFGLTIEALNGSGAVDPAFNGGITIQLLSDAVDNPPLEGTVTITAVDGVAVFSGLSIPQSGSYQIEATTSYAATVFSNSFTVVPSADSTLVFTNQPPTAVTSGATFGVDVAVADSQGNIDAGATGTVALALDSNPGAAALGGTLSAPVVNGVASFTGLTLNAVGAGYTLEAKESGLGSAVSNAVTVSLVGTATQLVITSQPPSTALAGNAFGLTVEAEDGFGAVDASFDGTVTLTDPSGGELSGTDTMSMTNGVATFTNLTLDLANSYNAVVAAAPGLVPATSNNIAVNPQVATQLVVISPAGNVLPNEPFSLEVVAEDANDNLDPTFNGSVTLTIATNSDGSTLGGTVTVNAVNGFADFSGLTLNNAGTGYTLNAASGLLSGVSQPFDVTSDQLLVAAQPPQTVFLGGGFGLTVAATTTAGETDTSFDGDITLTLNGPSGAALGGTTTVAAVDGVAAFTGLTVNQAGDYTITATGTDIGEAQSNPINVAVSATAFTGASSAVFIGGQHDSAAITTSGSPAAMLSETGALPAGVTFTANSDGTATVSGTPPVGTGSFVVNVTASNGFSSPVTEVFTVTVVDPPSFTSPATTTFSVGSSGSFTPSAAPGYPATVSFQESGILPVGVSFTGGKLSGKPTVGTGGVYPITFIAKNGESATAQPFNLIVDQTPTIKSAAKTGFLVGTSDSFTITTSGYPYANIQASALPAWLTLTPGANGSATLSGEPTATGTVTVTLTASNGVGKSATQTLVITETTAPTFTSAAAATFTVGVLGSFTTAATAGSPAATTLQESGKLPAGVSFSAGKLRGKPAAGTGGTYPITLIASNGSSSTSQSFALTVDQAPAVVSSGAASFRVGRTTTFTIAASGYPLPTITTGALPAWLTVSTDVPGALTLSGDPTSTGTISIPIAANNGVGAQASQSLSAVAGSAPVISSGASAAFTVGSPGSFTLAATGGYPAAATFTESGKLPYGVSFTGGKLVGKPASGTSGVYPITFTASNGSASSTPQSFTLIVDQPPAFASAAKATFATDQALTFTIVVSGYPYPSIAAATLPSWLTLTDHHNGTATLAGAPPSTGATTLTVTASGVATKATQTIAIAMDKTAVITSASSLTTATLATVNFTPTAAAGFPTTTTITESGKLPAGVNFGGGKLTGKPAAGTGGSYPITFTASNSGISYAQKFTIIVDQATAFTGAVAATFVEGQSDSVTVGTSGFPAADIQAGDLPTWLSFTDNHNGTATFQAFPLAGMGGSYSITLTASNGVLPNATENFIINIDQPALFTSASVATFTSGQQNSFSVTTTGFPIATISHVGTLPQGLTLVDNHNGAATLSGDPATKGTYQFTIVASNGVDDVASETFTLTVD
jgi:hypothetical protein